MFPEMLEFNTVIVSIISIIGTLVLRELFSSYVNRHKKNAELLEKQMMDNVKVLLEKVTHIEKTLSNYEIDFDNKIKLNIYKIGLNSDAIVGIIERLNALEKTS